MSEPKDDKTLIEELKAERDFYKKELEKFKLMVDWTPCTISWIKKDLTYVGVNKTLCDLCELSPEDFIGHRVGSHTRQEYFQEFSRELFEKDSESHFTNLSTSIDGEDKKFYLVGTKFNNFEEAVIIGLDITELARLQQTVGLMERLSSLGEMVAGIVHEINNPLTVVKNKSLMIQKYYEKGETERVLESAKSIGNTCDKITKIIEGVKTFVRQGHQDPYTEAYLHEIISEAVLLVDSKVKGAKVKVSLPEGPGPVVLANQTQLFQVFVNLVTNSVDAIHELGERWINIETNVLPDGEVVVRFTDSGDGIPEKLQENIFQSFYTTKGKGKGTGLGLSLCRKILETHHGTLEIDPKAKNTTFVIKLPKICQEPEKKVG